MANWERVKYFDEDREREEFRKANDDAYEKLVEQRRKVVKERREAEDALVKQQRLEEDRRFDEKERQRLEELRRLRQLKDDRITEERRRRE